MAILGRLPVVCSARTPVGRREAAILDIAETHPVEPTIGPDGEQTDRDRGRAKASDKAAAYQNGSATQGRVDSGSFLLRIDVFEWDLARGRSLSIGQHVQRSPASLHMNHDPGRVFRLGESRVHGIPGAPVSIHVHHDEGRLARIGGKDGGWSVCEG